MDLYEKHGLRRVVNAYDKATSLCGAVVLPEVAEAVAECLQHCYELDAVQEAAGRAIAEATGAEWGCVTACAAAGITLGVAASMTGKDAAKVAQLPDTDGMPCRVIIQKGHCINFGAPVKQMIRLSGARVVEVGDANTCPADLIRYELNKGDAAAVVAVESYHTVRARGPALSELAELAHAAGVPLIVDAATQELRLRELVSYGPDLVIASAHKYFSSTTAGIVAGRRDLVEAVYLQNRGIGRGMKAGKEAIFGVIAALEHHRRQDLAGWIAEENRKVQRVLDLLKDVPGVQAAVDPDPNGCPFSRVRLSADAEVTGHSAVSLTQALAAGDRTVVVRVYHPDEGCVYLNLTEMNDEEIAFACGKISEILSASNTP